MKKQIYIALSILAILLSSCEKELLVTSLTINKTTLALSQGATQQLTATVQPTTIPSTSTLGTVQWSSSNSSVATVVNGIVTAVSVGTAQIVAKAGSIAATCDVTVSAAIATITLNRTASVLLVDSTLNLTATLLPAPSLAVASNLIWTSTNPSVATVSSSGVVKAITTGSTSIVASIGTVTSVCSVSVLTSIPASLKGTNYYLISIDDATVNNFIGTNKIAADYRPDGVNNNLFVWNGFNPGTYNGTNFYGNAANWLSLVVTGAGGWSGAGYNVAKNINLDKLKNVTDDTSGKYYLHFAIKTSTTNSYEFQVGYGASAVIFVYGTAAMDNVTPTGNFTRDGNWQEIEIPISVLKAKGLNYTTGMAATNVFAMLAGGTAGVKLEMDAIFIYKKP